MTNWRSNLKKYIKTWSIIRRILHHVGTIFGDFLGSRRPPKSEFQRESVVLQFWVDFGCLLGPLLGTMLRQNGPPKLSKVTFFYFSTLPKSMYFPTTCWEAFGTLLTPSWDRFGSIWGKFLKPNSMPTSTLTKMSKLHFRFNENQQLKIQTHRKSIKNRCQNDLPSMFPRSSPKYSKSLPKWSQEGPKRPPKRCQNLTST